jgi:signal transduction histidine kinase
MQMAGLCYQRRHVCLRFSYVRHSRGAYGTSLLRTTLVQDPAIGGKSRARLAQIERAADTMRELVNALLTLAREDSAQHVEPIGMAQLIDMALAPFAGRLAEKGIDTIVDVDRGLHVLANRSALAIVLANVIDNAVRHTSRGRLRFSCTGGWLRIEDTGSGIPAHALPRVFDRLYRAEPHDADTRGFGIGLAIVKEICDRYDWPIELDSEPGRGTCVKLRLPAANPGRKRPAGGLTRF